MQTYERLQQLQSIEADFELLIKNDRKNWIKVAKLLDRIESTRLFELRANSFTQYVLNLAKVNHINVSTLWRARSAASVYMELAGIESVELLREGFIHTTPEQLEMYGKVRTIAPERIVHDLKAKMLKGEGIRNELRALWKTYRPLKQGKTERGRKKQSRLQTYQISPAESSQFLTPFSTQEQLANLMIAKSQYVEFKLDKEKLQKYNLSKEEMMRANIANALRSRAWAGYTLQETHISRFAYFANIIPGKSLGLSIAESGAKIDVVGFARKDQENPTPIIFGASICVNAIALKRMSFLEQVTPYCHYYYIAIPMEESFMDEAFLHIPRRWGIVGVERRIGHTRHELKVLRRSQLQEISCQKQVAILTELLSHELEWHMDGV